ncbi:MAG: FISUMP domain-containing protein, partial [Patescibacteria group bacterium]
TTLYNDGSPISTSNDLNEIMSTSSGLYSWYDNEEENSRSHNYGALYNFAAVVDSRGLCPDGWHLPSILEFEELIKGKNHQDLKDTSWDASSNSSGFSALPAGFLTILPSAWETPNFYLEGDATGFWIRNNDIVLTLFNPIIATTYMGTNEVSFYSVPEIAQRVMQGSVRCIEDNVKTITYKSSDGGKISLDDGVLKDEIVITVPFGGSHNQEIIATSNSDYAFTKWSDYNTSSTRLGENNVTDNIVLTTEFFKNDPIFDCGDKVLDTRDMEIYKTVEIGEQCWFQDNLRYLPVVHDNATYTNLTNDEKPSYGVYGYDGNDLLAAKNYKIGYNNFTFQAYPILGVLYNVSAVDQVTLCPSGWKIPNDNDWAELAKTVSGETSCDPYNYLDLCWRIEGKLKASPSDIIPWTGTNDFGFTALPVGSRKYNTGALGTHFGNFGTHTVFSSDVSSSWLHALANEQEWSGGGERFLFHPKDKNGYSVRCIKE